MNDESLHLRALARRVAAAYCALPQTRAAMLVGSAAEGLSDRFSDIDMSIFYTELPAPDVLAELRVQLGGGEVVWSIGEHAEGGFAEAFNLDGVEVQIGHTTVENWEHDIGAVLEQLDVTTPLHKAMDGTLHALPLYGEAHIQQWQARIAAFPDALAEAMVQHYCAFIPLWYMQERFATRDAALWYQQILLENAQHVLGVLAGLNQRYYSTFQFKRMRRFIADLPITPPDLADRLESLFTLDRPASIAKLETLVGEVVALVEQHMPQIDTRRVRRRLGQRQEPWLLE